MYQRHSDAPPIYYFTFIKFSTISYILLIILPLGNILLFFMRKHTLEGLRLNFLVISVWVLYNSVKLPLESSS